MIVENGPKLLAELKHLVMTMLLLSNDDSDKDAVEIEDAGIRPSLNRMATLYRPEAFHEAVCAKSSSQGCFVDFALTGTASMSQNGVR